MRATKLKEYAQIFVCFCVMYTQGMLEIAHGQEPAETPIFLRYQGSLEGSIEDLSNTIDCTFELLNGQDDTVFYERQRTILVIERRFTVTLGAGSSDSPPLTPNLLLGPTRLFVKCDLNNNGNHEVVTTEPIGPTPLAAVALGVNGFVETTSIKVNGEEVVSPDGEWVGEVATTGEVNASRIEGDTARINGLAELNELQVNTRLSSLEGFIASLKITELGHQAGLEADTTPLINDRGVWVGPIEFIDTDSDGAEDYIELLLGTDPLEASSVPADVNQDEIFDAFQINPNEDDNRLTLPFDPETFSHYFTTTQSADEFSNELSEGEEWQAAVIHFDQDGDIQELEITIDVSHESGIHHVAFALETPNGDRFQLLERIEMPADPSVTSATYRFSANEPPELFDWGTLLTEGEANPRPLRGVWSLYATNYSADQLSPVIAAFSITAAYLSPRKVTLTRDLDLAQNARITGIEEPAISSDVANKGYVDRLIAESVEALNEQITASERRLDPSYPGRFTYRYAIFETFDPISGNYFFAGHPELFAGVSTEAWSTAQVSASQLSISALDRSLHKEASARSNALISNRNFTQSDNRQGEFLIMHVQVENTTSEAISWPLQLELSCRNADVNGGHQLSSIALNEVEVYSTQPELCTSLSISASPTLTLPPEQLSDLVFVVSASEPNSINERRLMLALTTNSLDLPEGLVYRRTW